MLNKFEADTIIISYANKTINFRKLCNIKKGKIILFVHDQWLIEGFKHFNLEFPKKIILYQNLINFWLKNTLVII